MTYRHWRPAVMISVLACAACSGPALRQAFAPAEAPPAGATKAIASSAGADELAKARKSYEDGAYPASAKHFQAALDLGLTGGEQIDAHKHLAFIACAAHRQVKCRAEFRKALDIDSAFELSAAEAGHPLWGPAFRQVKRQVQAPSAARAGRG